MGLMVFSLLWGNAGFISSTVAIRPFYSVEASLPKDEMTLKSRALYTYTMNPYIIWYMNPKAFWGLFVLKAGTKKRRHAICPHQDVDAFGAS